MQNNYFFHDWNNFIELRLGFIAGAQNKEKSMIAVIGFVLYFVAGYFVVKRFPEIEANGEILAALMSLWPVLLIGKIIKVALSKIGCYHSILGNIFTVIVSLAVVLLFCLYVKEMCVSIVNVGK